MKDKQDRDVLVVGGGIAGMQSALVLAEMGYRVTIVDKGPAIGGYFPLGPVSSPLDLSKNP